MKRAPLTTTDIYTWLCTVDTYIKYDSYHFEQTKALLPFTFLLSFFSIIFFILSSFSFPSSLVSSFLFLSSHSLFFSPEQTHHLTSFFIISFPFIIRSFSFSPSLRSFVLKPLFHSRPRASNEHSSKTIEHMLQFLA